MAEPQVAAITWVHDSLPTEIKRDGQALRAHRVLVNNRQAAFLYEPNQTKPTIRIDEVVLVEKGGGFEISGRTEDGRTEVWFHLPVTKPASGCSSCSGH